VYISWPVCCSSGDARAEKLKQRTVLPQPRLGGVLQEAEKEKFIWGCNSRFIFGCIVTRKSRGRTISKTGSQSSSAPPSGAGRSIRPLLDFLYWWDTGRSKGATHSDLAWEVSDGESPHQYTYTVGQMMFHRCNMKISSVEIDLSHAPVEIQERPCRQ